jgi:hypothetical protein
MIVWKPPFIVTPKCVCKAELGFYDIATLMNVSVEEVKR